VELLHADLDGAASLLEGRSFDLVLCHAVVPYLETSAPTVHQLASLARAGGIVSFVAKNADAQALRPALLGRWSEALAAFDAQAGIGGLGVRTRGDRLADLEAMFDEAGLELLAWYGVRNFTDHLGAAPPGDDVETVVEVEWLASQRDPYRRLARLLHLVGRRRDSSGAAGTMRGS